MKDGQDTSIFAISKVVADSTGTVLHESSHLEALAHKLRDLHAIARAVPSKRLDAAMAAGDAIIAAREHHLKHGELGPWLEACGVSRRAAQDYVALAEARETIAANRHGRADFGIKAALRLIGRRPDRTPGRGHQSPPTKPTTDTTQPTEPMSDPVIATAAAVNRLNPIELQRLLDQLSPAHQRAFKQKFGQRNSDNALAEIATLASECSALQEHPAQHIDTVRQKLRRIIKLANGDGKAPGAITKNGLRLDTGALARGLRPAGPDEVDAAGNDDEPPVPRRMLN